jgi:hypothetical protein
MLTFSSLITFIYSVLQKYTMNSKFIPAVFVSLLLLLPLSSASVITRSLPQTALPGETVSVSLDVSITGGEAFYLLDEKAPAGWTITSPGSGDPIQPGHLKWVIIQNAANTRYTYEVKAPAAEGDNAFSGIYMFQGMAAEGAIQGDSSIRVVSALFKPGFDAIVAPLIILAALLISVVLYKARMVKPKSNHPEPEKAKKIEHEKPKKKKHV